MSERQVIENTWQFVCQWYDYDSIERSVELDINPFIANPGEDVRWESGIPECVHSTEFAHWLADEYRLAMAKGIELAKNAMDGRVAELEAENKHLVEIGNGFAAQLENAKHHQSLYGETVTQLQAELAELRSQRVSAMVLVYQPELTHSVWQDYGGMIDDETGEEIIRSHDELIEDLKQGVSRGEWVAWRLVRIEKEVMGNEQ